MKAERLAQVLKRMTDGEKPAVCSERVDSFLAYINARGLSSLLPRILHEYKRITDARAKSDGVIVTLAHKRPHHALLKTHTIAEDAQVRIDESIIGGYTIETSDRLIDASYKSALMKLYHSITK